MFYFCIIPDISPVNPAIAPLKNHAITTGREVKFIATPGKILGVNQKLKEAIKMQGFHHSCK